MIFFVPFRTSIITVPVVMPLKENLLYPGCRLAVPSLVAPLVTTAVSPLSSLATRTIPYKSQVLVLSQILRSCCGEVRKLLYGSKEALRSNIIMRGLRRRRMQRGVLDKHHEGFGLESWRRVYLL